MRLFYAMFPFFILVKSSVAIVGIYYLLGCKSKVDTLILPKGNGHQ